MFSPGEVLQLDKRRILQVGLLHCSGISTTAQFGEPTSSVAAVGGCTLKSAHHTLVFSLVAILQPATCREELQPHGKIKTLYSESFV